MAPCSLSFFEFSAAVIVAVSTPHHFRSGGRKIVLLNHSYSTRVSDFCSSTPEWFRSSDDAQTAIGIRARLGRSSSQLLFSAEPIIFGPSVLVSTLCPEPMGKPCDFFVRYRRVVGNLHDCALLGCGLTRFRCGFRLLYCLCHLILLNL